MTLTDPLPYRSYLDHISPIPLEDWPPARVADLVDTLQAAYPELQISGDTAPMPGHPQTSTGRLTLASRHTDAVYDIPLQAMPGPHGPGYRIGVELTDPISGRRDGHGVDYRCRTVDDATFGCAMYDAADSRMQSWNDLPHVLEARQARQVDDLAGALHHVEQDLTDTQRAAQFGVHAQPRSLAAELQRNTTPPAGRKLS